MILCMRTTITLSEDILKAIKQLAAERGKTLTATIEDSLRETLARRSNHQRAKVRLTTFKGNGLQPGVDLDDSASLLDLMEQ
jgi:hypothetical protein